MSTDRRLRFTLLGTGSSGGVPRVGNDWGACDPNEPKNARTRCSALVDVYNVQTADVKTRLLIDTSPDMRMQLLAQNVAHLDAILYTHDHADQTHGIDDVRALAIRHRKQIATYMDAETAATLFPKFEYVFEGSGGYPAILDLQPYIRPYESVAFTGQGGKISTLPVVQQHGRIRSLGFRFGALAYCNDLNGLPSETLNHLGDLDILIIDALRYTPHPSHAHLEQALAWIKILEPKRAVLTNLHVDMDYQTLLGELPEGVEPAYDGWSVEMPYAD